MPPQFIHLRLHTEYSLSNGLITLPALMEKTAADRMPAVAITDLNNLFASVKFYQSAFKAGIKPIIGVDLAVIDDGQDNIAPYRLTLLCQNNQGHKNLLKLISQSYLQGQRNGQPIIKKSWLQAGLAQGLIALSGGQEGDIGQVLLTAKEQKQALERVRHWQTLFKDRFYLEISRIGKPQEQDYISAVIKLAELTSVPLVATNEVLFLERDDFEAHEARVCIQEGTTLNDTQRPRLYTEQQYFRSQQEMQQLFADLPSALENSVEIAKRCNTTLTLGENKLPHFPLPGNTTAASYLAELAKQGLNERLQTIQSSQERDRRPYDERLARELGVINAMGFAGYFLIVADFTKWAKENGIPVGPGRGSGPGSLVAYALKITDLDPLAHALLFERFLNPERVSLPDFDIDFCVDGRDRVIEYVIAKHGQERVAQIITYGTMAAKAVVRDVGRALALGYGFVDKIAKLVPFELGITLDKALEQEPLLKERYENEEEVRSLIDLARKLEGLTRNVGRHAGGIVIAPGKLTDFVPLYCEPQERARERRTASSDEIAAVIEGSHPVTQYDKDDVEASGLVKFDFLGLKTLTIIDRALKVVNQNRLQKNEAPIDITLISLQDHLTFQLLKACKSTAIFQLESHGMRDLIKRLQPDCFEDLMALVALFRPGPLQSGMVDDFINRKHGRAKVMYPHPKLEPVLRPTYGVILYQEQVMQIAQVLAGYTLGAADILRHAMGKKKHDEMAKQRKIFCKGAHANGIDAELAEHIFDLMEKFAGYGFNKAHSASYALIAYQTAWLKAHYPAAYMAAVLSFDMDKTDKILVLLDECQTMKLHISPPDINKSEYFFNVIDDQHIMYGLGAIKGVGEAAIENMLAARKQQGHFKDLFDFCQRIDLRKINRRVLEALIKSGCFDSLGAHRAQLMASLNLVLQHAEQTLHNQTYGQHDFFGMVDDFAVKYVDATPWPDDVQLQGEKETLGFYLTGHPLRRYLNELAHVTTHRIVELRPGEHKTAKVAGIVTHVRSKQTKRGDRIGIFTLDDGTTQIEAVCFSEAYQKYRSLIIKDKIIIVEGEINIDDFSNNPRIVIRDVTTIEQARERHVKQLRLHVLANQQINFALLQEVLNKHRGGNCDVIIRYRYDNIQADIKLSDKWRTKPSDDLIALIQEQLAIENAEFVY